ncbi:hypothetical protein [Ottowia beijingensis]|uniref:hypothetical protein n=1 Tax=Ottowia beijingensis TaxID=1207057 RepID=UPI002FDA1A30
MKTLNDTRPPPSATRLALWLTAACTLALALLAAVSLLALNLHFESRDRERLHAHLAEARALLARVDQTAALTSLPAQLRAQFGDEADLAVRVQDPLGQPLYQQGPNTDLPEALLARPSAAAQPAPLVTWRQDGHAWRGSAMLIRMPLDGAAPLTVAMALDIAPQATFLTSFGWVLAGYVLLAALGLALLARWLVGRALGPPDNS